MSEFVNVNLWMFLKIKVKGKWLRWRLRRINRKIYRYERVLTWLKRHKPPQSP